MARDITIADINYNDVPSIKVPLLTSGYATYADTSDADAVAGDISLGKTAYVDGVKITGTGTQTPTQTKTETITSNGTTTITPDPGYNLSSVSVITNVPNPSTGRVNITNTSVVDVSTYAEAQIVDANLTAANIAKDVTVLGITGTHQGGIVPTGTYTITLNGVYDITTYEEVDVQVQSEPGLRDLCFTANTSGSTISMRSYGSPTTTPSFTYSTDNGENWNSFTVGSTTITLSNVGDKVYFRGNNPSGIGSIASERYYKFVMSGSISASGNIMSLIDNGACHTKTIPCDYCFNKLFYQCTSLTSAPSLPATTLTTYCYNKMFCACSGLTAIPSLPATTLADYCYYMMFESCTSLTSAPALLATSLALYCYAYMFRGCTSLTTPPTLPATTLAYHCYEYMFRGCTALTTAPVLSAITLAVGCYSSMFNGCSSLLTPPALPATTLASSCYNLMFRGCSGLTSKPDITNVTTYASSCFDGMLAGTPYFITKDDIDFYSSTIAATGAFNGLYAYSSITYNDLLTVLPLDANNNPVLPLTTLPDVVIPGSISIASGCYSLMFYECTLLTTPPKLPATTLGQYCYSNMFSGCTALTTAPTLQATTLALSCYNSMFRGCTSLITPPMLPATTLAYSCYLYMFLGCTSLIYGTKLPATYLYTAAYSMMFYGCTSLQVWSTSGTGHYAEWRIPYSGTCTNTDQAFQLYMFGNCAGTRTTSDVSGRNGESYMFYTQYALV